MREQIEDGLKDLITSLGVDVDNLDTMSAEDMMTFLTPLLGGGEKDKEQEAAPATDGVAL